MAIRDLFSKRESRKMKQGQEDVYQYDTLPEKFRVQVIHILLDALGRWRDGYYSSPLDHETNRWWFAIFAIMTRELGTFSLGPGRTPCDQCCDFLQRCDPRPALDLIEVAFGFVTGQSRELAPYLRTQYDLVDPDKAIDELNGRFLEAGVGYAFVGGQIVRIDSHLLHAEAVKPALRLLQDAGPNFAGPLEEFLEAYAKHRKGERKEAMAEALKSFESTMKAICTERSWLYRPEVDTAKDLLKIIFDHELVPTWLQSQFTALRSVLECGVPTVRNKKAGHGQGPLPVEVPQHFVAYTLHMTASNIVFLIESHRGIG